jgi:hypothetical protein
MLLALCFGYGLREVHHNRTRETRRQALYSGLRITVYDILDYPASGMTEDQILQDIPDLTREDIRASLAFAADCERKLFTIPA